ncbi:MAG: hypothetical protein WB290_17720 [Smithella sp.]
MNERLKNIRLHGKTARGKNELLKHLSGQKLTLKQAANAHCYDCAGYYADGKVACNMPHCSLFPFMPYNANREKRTIKRIMPKDHMERMRAARH